MYLLFYMDETTNYQKEGTNIKEPIPKRMNHVCVSSEVYLTLFRLKQPKESFNGVVERLVNFYKEQQKLNKNG